MRDPYRRSHCRIGQFLLCLLAFSLLISATTACSDEIWDPTGTLVLNEGTGTRSPGSGPLELPTETTGIGSIVIPSADPFENAAHVLRVDFLNTGNADAILLRADDMVILVDTGETDDIGKLRDALGKHNIRRIDTLIITHYDNDHIGTAAQLAREYEIGAVYMPDYIRDSRLYRTMVETLSVLEVPMHRLTQSADLAIPNGQITIHPTALYEPGHILGSDDSHALEENNYSLITTVRFGDIRLLLTGDAERERIEEFSAALAAGETFDLIKTPHHGGYDKGLGDLLRTLGTGNGGKLRYCVVSVGDASLVEASLVTAMRAAGAGAYYTYSGDIRFATDGVTMTMEQD